MSTRKPSTNRLGPCSPADVIVAHIKDQSSFVTACCNNLDDQDKTDVVHEIAMVAISFITGLTSVKAEPDSANGTLEP